MMLSTSSKMLVKSHEMGQTTRQGSVMSDCSKITIDPNGNVLSLVADSSGHYDIGDSNICTLPAWSGSAITSWSFIELVATTPANTTITLRAHDGNGHQLFWNTVTSAWVAAGSGDWNTAAELSAGLASWDVTLPLGIVIRLQTSDRRVTPAVKCVSALCSLDIVDFVEDVIHDTVIASLQDSIRPLSSCELTHTSGNTIKLVLGDYDGWDVTSVEWVRVRGQRVNLLSSFNATTRIITLTSDPGAATLDVLFRHKPIVAVQTALEFEENARLPAIEVNVASTDLGSGIIGASIANIYADPMVAVILPAPRRTHITFSLELKAPLSRDLMRLVGEVTAWLDKNKVIISGATGEETTLVVESSLQLQASGDSAGIHSASGSFRLQDFNNWNREPEIKSGAVVTSLTVNFPHDAIDVE